MGGQQNQSWYLYLHTVLLTVVLAMIRSVFPHAHIRSEDADGAAFYSPNHRPDIVVLDFEGGGRHLLIDVSVARPLALSSHVAGASLTAGYTADRAERAKLLAYGVVGHHRVVPFVLEEFGAMGPLTSAFFKEHQVAGSGRTGWTWRASGPHGRRGPGRHIGVSACRWR
eukprot:jgi/Mesvir1/21969/Mv26455-RA.1